MDIHIHIHIHIHTPIICIDMSGCPYRSSGTKPTPGILIRETIQTRSARVLHEVLLNLPYHVTYMETPQNTPTPTPEIH